MDILKIIGGTAFFVMIGLFMCAAAWHAAPGGRSSWNNRTDPEVLGFVSSGFMAMFVSGLSLAFIAQAGSEWLVICIAGAVVGFLGGVYYGSGWYFRTYG